MFARALTFVLAIMLFGSEISAETYEYDPAGRLIAVRYDDGSSISYNYDAAGNRLRLMAVPEPTELLSVVAFAFLGLLAARRQSLRV